MFIKYSTVDVETVDEQNTPEWIRKKTERNESDEIRKMARKAGLKIDTDENPDSKE